MLALIWYAFKLIAWKVIYAFLVIAFIEGLVELLYAARPIYLKNKSFGVLRISFVLFRIWIVYLNRGACNKIFGNIIDNTVLFILFYAGGCLLQLLLAVNRKKTNVQSIMDDQLRFFVQYHIVSFVAFSLYILQVIILILTGEILSLTLPNMAGIFTCLTSARYFLKYTYLPLFVIRNKNLYYMTHYLYVDNKPFYVDNIGILFTELYNLTSQDKKPRSILTYSIMTNILTSSSPNYVYKGNGPTEEEVKKYFEDKEKM